MPLSPQEAAAELLKRRAARKSLLPFTEKTFSLYRAAPHHQLIADRLEAVERGEIKRLMVFMPPRAGKSELVSRRFPAWCIGRNEGLEVISATYNSEFAADFGRDVRGIVADPLYGMLFPGVGLRADSSAADRWHTTNGCAYRAAGVGTAMTGRGADLLIIDDPVKDRAESDSELQRNRVWDWYRATAYTRLSPGGRIVICQTRWHEDDLSGRLLEAMAAGGERWDVLDLPAINDNGEPLWPERFPLERLEAIRKVIGAREWSALYQQRPQPDEGTFFQRAWFEDHRYTAAPTPLHVYMTSDHARSQDEGDYTVLRAWGVDTKRDLYLLGGWRGQATTDVWTQQAVALIRQWKPLCWFAENDATWGSVAPFVRTMLREAGLGVRIETMSTRGDKPTKAQAFQGMAAQGRVHLPVGKSGDDVMDEYLRFPTGKHDDEVDAAAHMGRAIADAHPAVVSTKQAPRLDVWGRPVREERSWKTA